MKTRSTPTKGQIIYSLNIGNTAGRGRPSVLTPMIVTNVGRKYFTLKIEESSTYGVDFYLSNWQEKNNFCQDHKLYETVEEWELEVEEAKICRAIADSFKYGRNIDKLSIEKLREIQKILDKTDLVDDSGE